ncbi:MAG: PIN domain-containing protein [Treponema sp.]|nr:PIN domain-containing protein [Treponema sp.]
MPHTVLVDAGPLIALFDRSDAYHEKTVSFIRALPCHLVSTLAVLTEVSHMLNFNVNAQIDFLEWVMIGGLRLQTIEQDDMAKLIGLTKKYRDLPCDLADATLVLTAEKTGIRSIISIDSDFYVYRLPGKLLIKNIFPG